MHHLTHPLTQLSLVDRKSRRVPAARRYKVIKKIAASKQKKAKEAKKLPTKSIKQKLIQIPNVCPFKEDILKDVEAEKARREEEKRVKIEKAKEERAALKKTQTLESIVNSANVRADQHVEPKADDEAQDINQKPKENSLKAFYKEFKKVVDAADVILEVCDARDPLGTRCSEVSSIIRESPGQKKHVLILNKSDLVPRENLESWLTYLRRFGPVVPFKASTQNQKTNIGRKKFARFNKSKNQLQASPCVGANLLMSLLANYCRNKDMKTSIRVGIVGIPNVGKSSIINSLKRRRACQVGATPGMTRVMQEVEIDSNIKLIDSPGIIFQRPKSESPDEFFALKNAQHINTVQDPFPLACDILKRATVMYFCKLYDITEFKSPEEFLAKKAIKMGKLIRGGVPDVRTAARSVIHDWNIGKIKYQTHPPADNSMDVHLSASIVTNPSEKKELEIDNLAELDKSFINELDEHYKFGEEVMEVDTKGPVSLRPETKRAQSTKTFGGGDIIEGDDDEDMEQTTVKKKRKGAREEEDGYSVKKIKGDSVFKIKGNQTVNKSLKSDAKKLKKAKNKTEKKVSNVADVLDNFTLGDDKYDFDDDYVVEWTFNIV